MAFGARGKEYGKVQSYGGSTCGLLFGSKRHTGHRGQQWHFLGLSECQVPSSLAAFCSKNARSSQEASADVHGNCTATQLSVPTVVVLHNSVDALAGASLMALHTEPTSHCSYLATSTNLVSPIALRLIAPWNAIQIRQYHDPLMQ